MPNRIRITRDAFRVSPNLFGREKGKKNKRKTYWTAIATATSHDELLLLLIRVVVGIVVVGGAFLFAV